MTEAASRAAGSVAQRRRRWCCAGCLAPVLLVLAAMGLLLSAPPEPPLPSPEVVRRNAERVRSAASEIERSARRTPRMGFELRLTEEDLNSFLASDPSVASLRARASVERAWVSLEDGGVRVSGRYRAAGVPLTATATVRLSAGQDGILVADVLSLHLGRVSMPGASREKLADMAAEAIAAVITPGEIRIESVDVRDRTIVMRGRSLR